MLTQRHIVLAHVAGEHGFDGSVLLGTPVSPSLAQNLLTEKQRSTHLSSHVKKSLRTNFESQLIGLIYRVFLANENLLPYLFISVSGLIDNWGDICSF